MSTCREFGGKGVLQIMTSSPEGGVVQHPMFGPGVTPRRPEGVAVSPLPGLDRLVCAGDQVRLLESSGDGPYLAGSLLGQLAGLLRPG